MKYLQKRAIIKPLSGRIDRLHCYRRAVVIPALAEAESLPLTLQSLYANEPHNILFDTLILIVVNNRPPGSGKFEETPELKDCIRNNALTLRLLENHTSDFPYHLAWIDASSPGNELPPWGGVGLARKIGCDSVLSFLQATKNPTPLQEFIFFSLDADALVSSNYLEAAGHELFLSGKSGGVIPFKHQQAGSPEGQSAIDAYESFLNYYVEGLRWAGSPYAFHTVGSCLCFTGTGYIKANGFPARRQAGEDFYFCMELFKTGGVCEIQNTRVFPSSRISLRVPFGTGRRMAEALVYGKKDQTVYDFHVFACLRGLLSAVVSNIDRDVDCIYAAIDYRPTIDFLESRGLSRVWKGFQKQYKTNEGRLHAFHCWFDGFVTLKYIHWLTDNVWPRQPLEHVIESGFHRF